MYYTTAIEEIRATLSKFQEGYVRRDVGEMDAFMGLFVPDEDVEVIGTGALERGTGEWCLGRDAVYELVKSDWQGWGDFRVDIDGAHIFALGDVAWLATTATVSLTIEREKGYNNTIEYAKTILERESMSAEQKLWEILMEGISDLYELQRGETFVFPLRFTAVLVRRDGNWLFHQMQFSHATTRFPDERVLE